MILIEVTPIPKPAKKKKRKRSGFKSQQAKVCWYCGKWSNPPYVVIEKHHLKHIGMGGSSDPQIDDPENEMHLCSGPGSNHCHRKAHDSAEGYSEEELKKKREEHFARQAKLDELFPIS